MCKRFNVRYFKGNGSRSTTLTTNTAHVTSGNVDTTVSRVAKPSNGASKFYRLTYNDAQKDEELD